ncbi:MAG: hypothetical protein ABWZ99_02685 [Ilumatobacteraceae bacterium]
MHPLHGIHAPRPCTPPRVPGSIRRTSTIDSIRPGEILGDLVQIGRSRDLRTALDGTVAVMGEASVETRLVYTENCRLTEIATTPGRPELEALLGAGVTSGFRAAVIALLPDEVE